MVGAPDSESSFAGVAAALADESEPIEPVPSGHRIESKRDGLLEPVVVAAVELKTGDKAVGIPQSGGATADSSPLSIVPDSIFDSTPQGPAALSAAASDPPPAAAVEAKAQRKVVDIRPYLQAARAELNPTKDEVEIVLAGIIEVSEGTSSDPNPSAVAPVEETLQDIEKTIPPQLTGIITAFFVLVNQKKALERTDYKYRGDYASSEEEGRALTAQQYGLLERIKDEFSCPKLAEKLRPLVLSSIGA